MAQDTVPGEAPDVARLATAPTLGSDGLTLGAAALADGEFVWLEIPTPGVYEVASDAPGALFLLTFDTEDGAFDGRTRPSRHGVAASRTAGPVLGPVFLGTGHPYLVSVSAATDARLTLRLISEAPGPAAADLSALPPGPTLLTEVTDRTLSVPAGDAPVSLEVIPEARASADARIDGETVDPATGLFPWLAREASDLRIRAARDGDAPPPMVLVRLADAPSGLDETEPNEDVPNPWDGTEAFRGILLPSDADHVELTLDAPRTVALRAETDSLSPDFDLFLSRMEGRDEVALWSRTAIRGRVEGEALSLAPGRYRVALDRRDDEATAERYILSLGNAQPGLAGREAEPNDTRAAAQPISPNGIIRGTGAPGDRDVYALSLPADRLGHLWNIFAVGVERLTLLDSEGAEIEDYAPGTRRISLAPFGFDPGTYYVAVEAAGPYTLKLMDLGPRPDGFEAEPNGDRQTAQTLQFGAPARGGLHRGGDVDSMAFRLAADTAVEIAIDRTGTGPASGDVSAWLYHGERQFGGDLSLSEGGATSGGERYRAILPAGDWSVRLRADGAGPWDGYAVTVTKVPAAGITEPDDDLARAAKLARDGDHAGSVGGFDAADTVFVPLPVGAGDLLAICDDGDGALRWTLSDIRVQDDGGFDGERLAVGRDGLAAVLYPAALGGALRLEIEGARRSASYACALRVLAGSLPWPKALSGGDGLGPGGAVRMALPGDGNPPDIPLQIGPGRAGLVGCRLGGADGPPLSEDAVDLRSAAVLRDWGRDGFRLFRASEGAALRIRADRVDGDGPVICALVDPLSLPGPGEAGPAAPFAPAGADGVALTALADLIARPSPDTAPRGTLPVTIAVNAPQAFAAFFPAGQAAEVTVTLQNDGDAPAEVRLEARLPGEGWGVVVPDPAQTLPPGSARPVTVEVTAPPWLNPYDAPSLDLTVRDGAAFRAQVIPLPVSAIAVPRAPKAVWHAPEALRGGQNVLHAGLGAEIVAVDGEATDDRDREALRPLHDGIAPHISAANSGRDLTFRLAAPTHLAGAVVQLRSTADPATWPASVRFLVSGDGKAWRPVGAAQLGTTHAPQYVVFEDAAGAAPSTHLRAVFPSCRTPCREVRVQEIQAIARPGDRATGPVNIADPALGGHVVYTQPNLTSDWNRALLIDEERGGQLRWRPLAPVQSVVIGFHQNRAARIAALRWIGDEADDGRLPPARVMVSTNSPAGPWHYLGDLPPPAAGVLVSEVVLPAPRWARYVRLEFDMAEQEGPAGPNAIEVIEADGPSVLGLWEDDRPEAAYEAGLAGLPPEAAPPLPAGGAGVDRAVPLAVGESVASSVQIGRNDDWWRLTVPDGPPRTLDLQFDTDPPLVTPALATPDGRDISLERDSESGIFRSAPLGPGDYLLQVAEPPRSVVIAWDTSGSVGAYIPLIRAAVLDWAEGLVPGRDAMTLLPFGVSTPLVEGFAGMPDPLIAALRDRHLTDSSAAETAMRDAARALRARPGAHGIIVLTDAETPQDPDLWPALLDAMPRVVALSIGSDTRRNAAILMDWADLNGGEFRRVTSPIDLAEGLDLAAALFRNPKGYAMTATLAQAAEPEGTANLTVLPRAAGDAVPSGAVQLVLDASGSMLQRLEGRRRIEIAHDALTGLVRDTLPEGMPFAFRAFGLEKDACRTELRVPLGPLDRGAAMAAIRDVPAINLARTAIADSLRSAGADLATASPPRVIVLVTDGEETCDGDPMAEIEALRAAGLDIRLNIVGFAIDDAALSGTFAAWASAGGGRYFAADGAEALERAVADALLPRFEVTRLHLDGRREALGQIALGETMAVPAGQLLVAPAAGAAGSGVELRLAPDGVGQLEYSAAGGLIAPAR